MQIGKIGCIVGDVLTFIRAYTHVFMMLLATMILLLKLVLSSRYACPSLYDQSSSLFTDTTVNNLSFLGGQGQCRW